MHPLALNPDTAKPKLGLPCLVEGCYLKKPGGWLGSQGLRVVGCWAWGLVGALGG